MIPNLRSERGMAVVLAALAMTIVMAAISLMSTFSAGIQNRQVMKRINKGEGFLLSEIASWVGAEGNEATGSLVSYDNNYTDGVSLGKEVCSSESLGCPFTLSTTKKFDIQDSSNVASTFRRYTGKNLTLETKSATHCGLIDFGTGPLHACIVGSITGGPPPPQPPTPNPMPVCASLGPCSDIIGWTTVAQGLPSVAQAVVAPTDFSQLQSGKYYIMQKDMTLTSPNSVTNVVLDGQGKYKISNNANSPPPCGVCCPSSALFNSYVKNLSVVNPSKNSVFGSSALTCFENVTYLPSDPASPPLLSDVSGKLPIFKYVAFPNSHGGPLTSPYCEPCS